MAVQPLTKDQIIAALDELPPETLSAVGEFIEFLRFKSGQPPKRLIRLGGLWRNLPPITEQDIADARREMWSNFGERDV